MTLPVSTQAPEAAEVTTAGSLPRLMRPTQVYELTGIPKEVIYAALASGELPALDFARPPRPGKRKKPLWYIDPEDLRAWIETKKTRMGGK